MLLRAGAPVTVVVASEVYPCSGIYVGTPFGGGTPTGGDSLYGVVVVLLEAHSLRAVALWQRRHEHLHTYIIGDVVHRGAHQALR